MVMGAMFNCVRRQCNMRYLRLKLRDTFYVSKVFSVSSAYPAFGIHLGSS